MPRPAVLLDRDGTLIDFVRDTELGIVTPAFHPQQIRFLPGVIAGLQLLVRKGFALAVATNQPGAAKGEISREAITRTNDALVESLDKQGIGLLEVAVCLHHPDGGPGGDPELIRTCNCRKPGPGLLLDLCERYELDKQRSYFVGDTPTDLQAAHAAGLRSGILAQPDRCELCKFRGSLTPGSKAPDRIASRLDLWAVDLPDLAASESP